MRKKVKSFALEEGPYEKLYQMFKDYYVEIGISYCVNRYLKEFLEYLESVQKVLQANSSFTVPMPFIIETIAREPTFKIFDSESSINQEVTDLQNKYNVYIKKNSEKANVYNVEAINAEVQFAKVIQFVGMAIWKEKKIGGRELTDDELTELARKIGGKEFLKGIRTKLKPIADKLNKYDPDMGELWEKMSSKLFKKQTKEGE